MIDALGLAETPPGPLVLVLHFVGFLGAASGGSGLHPVLAGLLGSLIVLWTTFLPCFAWTFAGAPFIETLQRIRALNASLAAITACVVGVVLSLSVWFAAHVFFSEVGRATWGPASVIAPSFDTVDFAAIVLAGAAALALLRLKAGLLATLGSAALAGAALSLFA
jgi:chromate transporter